MTDAFETLLAPAADQDRKPARKRAPKAAKAPVPKEPLELINSIEAKLTELQADLEALVVPALANLPLIKLANATDAAILQAAFKDAHDRADRVKAEIGKTYDWLRTNVVPERMDNEGLEMLRITGIGRVSLKSEINLSVLDKDAEYRWLEETGHGDMIQETVNAGSLKALLVRMLREGKEIPGDIFKVTPVTKANITKG